MATETAVEKKAGCVLKVRGAYGWIADHDKVEHFFHLKDVVSTRKRQYRMPAPGSVVTFVAVPKSPQEKSPRATLVEVVDEQA